MSDLTHAVAERLECLPGLGGVRAASQPPPRGGHGGGGLFIVSAGDLPHGGDGAVRLEDDLAVCGAPHASKVAAVGAPCLEVLLALLAGCPVSQLAQCRAPLPSTPKRT